MHARLFALRFAGQLTTVRNVDVIDVFGQEEKRKEPRWMDGWMRAAGRSIGAAAQHGRTTAAAAALQQPRTAARTQVEIVVSETDSRWMEMRTNNESSFELLNEMLGNG